MSNHPNMSYCMWQNTYQALLQCSADLEERMSGRQPDDGYPDEPRAKLSRDEHSARLATLNLMAEMLEQAGATVDIDDMNPDFEVA